MYKIPLTAAWHSAEADCAAAWTLSASHVDCTQEVMELTKVWLLQRQAVSAGSQVSVLASEMQDVRQAVRR